MLFLFEKIYFYWSTFDYNLNFINLKLEIVLLKYGEVLDNKSLFGISDIGIRKLNKDKNINYQKPKKIKYIYLSPSRRLLQTFD